MRALYGIIVVGSSADTQRIGKLAATPQRQFAPPQC